MKIGEKISIAFFVGLFVLTVYSDIIMFLEHGI